MHAVIKGIGSFLPDKVLTNKDLERIVDTTDEWITTRTGIKERRILDKGKSTSYMGIAAAEKAIADSGLDKSDIDFIIVATVTPDYMFPSTAALIGAKLDIGGIPGIDIEAACTGFIYALTLAEGLILSKKYRNILIIAADNLTKIVDWTDRATCVLFGDGAGAVVLSGDGSDEFGIINSYVGADGNFEKILSLPAGGSRNPASEESIRNKGHFIKMTGNTTFKIAVKKMGESAEKVLNMAGIAAEDIQWLIPHQANYRIITATAKRLHLDPSRVFIDLEKYGNTSGASIAIAMADLYEQGKLHQGDFILLDAFGGGLTWGAILLKWAKKAKK